MKTVKRILFKIMQIYGWLTLTVGIICGAGFLFSLGRTSTGSECPYIPTTDYYIKVVIFILIIAVGLICFALTSLYENWFLDRSKSI